LINVIPASKRMIVLTICIHSEFSWNSAQHEQYVDCGQTRYDGCFIASVSCWKCETPDGRYPSADIRRPSGFDAVKCRPCSKRGFAIGLRAPQAATRTSCVGWRLFDQRHSMSVARWLCLSVCLSVCL